MPGLNDDIASYHERELCNDDRRTMTGLVANVGANSEGSNSYQVRVGGVKRCFQTAVAKTLSIFSIVEWYAFYYCDSPQE